MSKITQGSVYDFGNITDLRGDFIGFTFDGVHSSELGIVRVSGGDRYEESLIPSSTLKTVAVPGGDGTYYFGMNYTQRNITLNIAYDSLTQNNLNRLISLCGSKRIVQLIYDEEPYKIYNVKVSADPRLTYICFDENGQRIYKGEGTISLVCYSPFARSRYKYIEDYTITNIPEWAPSEGSTRDYVNLDEWKDASGIRTRTYDGKLYDNYDVNTGKILLYNGGQIPTDFNLYIPFSEGSTTIPSFYIELNTIGMEDQLHFLEITQKNERDKKIKINTKINLIEGVDENNTTTGSVYNEYIEKGNFFKIPLGESELHTIEGIAEEEIEYSFLYY